MNDGYSKPNFDKGFTLLCWSVYNIDSLKKLFILIKLFYYTGYFTILVTLLYWLLYYIGTILFYCVIIK